MTKCQRDECYFIIASKDMLEENLALSTEEI
jgi:hypothetical protein